MDEHRTGQLVDSAAEVYERFFVPALFAEWPSRVLDAAGVARGHRVLDVGCGTGLLARAAADRVGVGGAVVGVDPNPGMLAVARRTEGVEWREGRAESLPFEDRAFDAVVSQFALMFFEDRVAGLREMARVARPGGAVVVAVWDTLERTPGYLEMAAILREVLGDEAAESLRAPYSLGEVDALRALFAAAELGEPAVETVEGTARFDSIEAWLHTDIRGWTLAGTVGDADYARLLDLATERLDRFVGEDGRVSFPAPAHLARRVVDR